MLPFIGPLISAGANLLGGIMGNDAAAQQASAQRAWETQMSSTSWQRGVADMRAAGINPMLAYMQGGASTPGGAMAGVPNPNVLGDTVSSAMSMMTQMKQQKLLESQAYNQNMQGYSSLVDALGTQLEKFPWMVGDDTPGGRVSPPDSPAWSGVRYRLGNALMAANTASANAAAQHSLAGIPLLQQQTLTNRAQFRDIMNQMPTGAWRGQHPFLSWLTGPGAAGSAYGLFKGAGSLLSSGEGIP